MRTYTPALSRCIGSLVMTAVCTALTGAGWAFLWSVLDAFRRLEPRKPPAPLETEAALYVVLALIAGIGLLASLLSLSLTRMRYEIGATEIVIHQGLLWKSTRTIPIPEILKIDVSSGPVQRWLGHSDLHLATLTQPAFPVKLCGIQGADDLRRHLMDRKESLREAAVEDSPKDLALERLAKAIERLEGRLTR